MQPYKAEQGLPRARVEGRVWKRQVGSFGNDGSGLDVTVVVAKKAYPFV